MKNKESEIIFLKDLNSLRTAPKLTDVQSKILIKEVNGIVGKAEWLTIGIMAPSIRKAIEALRKIEERYGLNKMQCITLPKTTGPVFLKANQISGEIHARLESGLGEGILISCHSFDNSIGSETIGPLPLDIYNIVY